MSVGNGVLVGVKVFVFDDVLVAEGDAVFVSKIMGVIAKVGGVGFPG